MIGFIIIAIPTWYCFTMSLINLEVDIPTRSGTWNIAYALEPFSYIISMIIIFSFAFLFSALPIYSFVAAYMDYLKTRSKLKKQRERVYHFFSNKRP